MELGYPVILVYLGFLGAEEMRMGRNQTPFDSHGEWVRVAKVHSEPLFPAAVWDRQRCIRSQAFYPRICWDLYA